MFAEPLLQRLQPPAGTPDPVGQRRAVQLHTAAGEDLALPIERKVVGIFADQDMGEQAWAGQALGDRTLRRRRLVDRAAGAAAIARPTHADHPQPGGHMVQHLAHRLADRMQRATAAGAGAVFDIEADVLARQMCRKTGAIRLGPATWRLGHRPWRKPSLGPRDVGVQVFEAQLQLIIIKALGAAAELVALQLLDDQLEAFDLGLRLGEVGPLGRQQSHHPVQRLNIVRQSGKIDVHGHKVYADSQLSSAGLKIVSHSAAASSRCRRSPLLLRRAPIHPVDQSTELHACECQRSAGLDVRRPQEHALLQPFGEEAQPATIPEHDLDQVGLAAAEHKKVTAEGILPQHALNQHRQPIDPLAHVGEAERQMHFRIGGQEQRHDAAAALGVSTISTVTKHGTDCASFRFQRMSRRRSTS